jgi:hypothetical protein
MESLLRFPRTSRDFYEPPEVPEIPMNLSKILGILTKSIQNCHSFPLFPIQVWDANAHQSSQQKLLPPRASRQSQIVLDSFGKQFSG